MIDFKKLYEEVTKDGGFEFFFENVFLYLPDSKIDGKFDVKALIGPEFEDGLSFEYMLHETLKDFVVDLIKKEKEIV